MLDLNLVDQLPVSCCYVRLNKPLDPERAQFPKVGSKFRYSGRTQYQAAGAPDSDRPAMTIRRGAKTRFLRPTDTIETTSKYLCISLSSVFCCRAGSGYP